jgi:hypothetical protein
MTEKLSACPNRYCRSENVEILKVATKRLPLYGGWCNDCGTYGPKDESRNEATIKWNTHFLRDTPWIEIGSGELPEDLCTYWVWEEVKGVRDGVWDEDREVWLNDVGCELIPQPTHFKSYEDPGTP